MRCSEGQRAIAVASACLVAAVAEPCALGGTTSLSLSMLDEQQIQRRRPVWVALSELWLDTELSTEDLERIARVMAGSGLTIQELRQVYLVEVAPVVSPNLLTPAGEWVGFDEEWLCSHIIRNLRERPRRTRFWAWFPLTRGPMLYATERHWTRLAEFVQSFRDANRAV